MSSSQILYSFQIIIVRLMPISTCATALRSQITEETTLLANPTISTHVSKSIVTSKTTRKCRSQKNKNNLMHSRLKLRQQDHWMIQSSLLLILLTNLFVVDEKERKTRRMFSNQTCQVYRQMNISLFFICLFFILISLFFLINIY